MDIAVLACAIFFIAGVFLALTICMREVRRQADFLASRSASSGSRVRVHLPGKSWKLLAFAINDALDAVQQSHIDEMRRSRDLQEDIAAISHDMKTPLAGARGYIQLGQREIGRNAEKANVYFGSAIERVDAAAALLDTLSVYVQTQDPDRKYHFESIPLLPLVIEVLTNQLAELEKRGWEPVVNFSDESICIMADRTALKRILTNLVTNALRYGVSAPRIEETKLGNSWQLSISNAVGSVEGIDPSLLFHRFYRGDPSRGTRGTGLGLSIAKTLATDMDFALDAKVTSAEAGAKIGEDWETDSTVAPYGGTITFVLKQAQCSSGGSLTPSAALKTNASR